MRRSIAALLLATLVLVPGCVPLALAGGAVAMSMISQQIDRQEAVRKAEATRQRQLLQDAADQRRRQEIQEQQRLARIAQERKEELQRQRQAATERQRRLGEERQRQELQERQRLARIAQEREEELKRQRQAAAERQRRLEEERRRQEALERKRLAQQAEEREEQRHCERLAAAERERKAEEERRRLAKLEQLRRENIARAAGAMRTIDESLRLGRWDKARLREVMKVIELLDKSTVSEQSLGQLHLAVGLYAYLVDDLALARREWRRAQQLGATKPRTVLAEMWTPGALEVFHAAKQ